MKIGVDATCWGNKRGYGRFTRELLEAILRIDTTNEYVYFVDRDSANRLNVPESVKLIVAKTKEAPIVAAADGRRRSLRDIWAMSRAVMRHNLDIFFFPTMYSFFPVFNRTKIVVTLHDMIADNHPELTFSDARSRYFWKLKEKIAVSQANVITTVSQHSKDQIRLHFNVPESRIRIISEAARPVFQVVANRPKATEVLTKYGASAEVPFLLYVGGISPHKNLSNLIDAFAKVRGKLRSAIQLVLVGDYKDDPFLSDYPALRSKIYDLRIDSAVVFTGFVPDDDLVYLYNSASLLVFPSLDEGFGLPAVEAMACGTPVAASNRGSLSEVLGEAGAYFDPFDIDDIAGVILSLLQDPQRRRKMAELGLIRSRQFQWEKSAEQTLAVFNELGGSTEHRG